MAKRRGLPQVKVIPEYTEFKGGLDLETPPMKLPPGALITGMNYTAGTDGGYERIDGYERFSGQPSPSDATYYYCPCTFTAGGPSAGDTITGVDSAETAVVISVFAAYINVTKLSGDFNADEVFTVGGIANGTFTAAQSEKGETSPLLNANALNLAADAYRSDISKPAGSGAGRGLALLAGVLYAFRDNAAGTAGLIYKQTAAGWVAVTPGNEVSFGAGTGLISEGDTITGAVSGAKAVVARVVLESGAWGTDAAGRLIIGAVTGGPFQNPENLTVSGVEAATTSLVTAIVILPGGRYETVVYNFTGSTSTRRIYGADGKNRGFEFDGTVYVPIATGMTTDTPEYVSAYKYQLFFSFKGSNQNSGPGYPYEWSPVVGAAEIGVGDDITGYARRPKALLINSRDTTNQLLGSDVSDFELDDVSDDTGAIPRTIQILGRPYWLDDRGIVELLAVQEYGNFNASILSRKIQVRINAMRVVVVASAVYRTKSQYRLYGSDGTGICMTVSSGQYGLTYQFTQFLYPLNVACTISGEDSTGKDVVFFADDAGMVYQADKGSSFDGEDIEAYLFLPFNNSKMPTSLKTYRKAIIEMTSDGYSSIRYIPIFSYGNSDIQAHLQNTIPTYQGGGLWGFVDWSEFFWDSDVVPNPSFTIAGDGINMSLTMYSKSDIDLGHKLDGVTVHFTPRRLVR